MSKKTKKKRKPRSTSLLNNANYATSGSGNNPTKYTGDTPTQELAKSRKSFSNARKMAKIEAYAKEKGITVAKAMIHFM